MTAIGVASEELLQDTLVMDDEEVATNFATTRFVRQL